MCLYNNYKEGSFIYRVPGDVHVVEEDFLYNEYEIEPIAQSFSLNLNDTVDKYICDICGEMCLGENHMLEHERTHNEKRRTDEEDTNTRRKKPLPFFNKNNSGEFECNVCQQTFALKSNVREHYFKYHRKSERLQCPQCEFSCYSKCALDVHLVKCHTKRYACEVCGKMFAYKYQLKTHINGVHLNIRNHTCDVCGKSFKTRANFDTHMSRHQDVRNFRCPYCPHRSRTNHDLTVHVRRHTGERPYNCDVCGRAFAHSINKLKHERSVHGKSQNSALIIRFPDNELPDD